MNGDKQDPSARRLDLLKQLEGRGLARASDYFARQDAPAGGCKSDGYPAEAGTLKPRPFARLFPAAEFRPRADGLGGACAIVRSEAALGLGRTAQGYQCPAAPFGGPPSPAALAELTGDPRWAELDPARILYLDTETTSLAMGAGTYTFLIGMGRFDGPIFRVDQYFMEDYADEAALVEAADAVLADAQALVSYNGRTFDIPLLESRWRLQRRRPRFPELHLDLLHTARRLWRLRLPDCSLARVESAILGVSRVSDVDGSWVPRIYFDFTRGIRAERIVPVVDHHAQDIYSLGALAAAAAWGYANPTDPRFAHAGDQWGLARLFEAHGRRKDAIACMEAAVLAARDEEFGFRLAMHLARTYKRHGRAADAVAIWEARVAQAAPGRLDPLVELAKHAEHTLKDFITARGWAERALKILEGHTDLKSLIQVREKNDAERDPAGFAQELAALSRRMTRLDQKHERAKNKKNSRKKKK